MKVNRSKLPDPKHFPAVDQVWMIPWDEGEGDEAVKIWAVTGGHVAYEVLVVEESGEPDSCGVAWAARHWSKPPPKKPEWLNSMWVNVYSEPPNTWTHPTAQLADTDAGDRRIGRICIGTGEWVPCAGRKVLS